MTDNDEQPQVKADPFPWKDLKGKQGLWLKAYLDESNPKTFLNKKGSARAAKYACKNDDDFGSVGYQNSIKLQALIGKWLDEYGLSEEHLKTTLRDLMNGKSGKIMTIKGTINEEDLPEGSRVIAVATEQKCSKDGQLYDEINTIVEIGYYDPELCRRTVDMGLKVKGMNAPEKRIHSGDQDNPIRVQHSMTTELQDKLAEIYAEPAE